MGKLRPDSFLVIALAIAAVAVVYGTLWIFGYGIGEWRDWRWRKRVERDRRPGIRWETVMDPRTAHFAALALPSSWDEAEPPPIVEPDTALPDGLIERDGVILFECRSCGEWTELPCGPEEFDPDALENVCGGSKRCCP